MFTSQNGVLHTSAFSRSGQRARIPVDWIKRPGGRVIFVYRDALAIGQRTNTADERPRQLEPALAAVAPMDEHPEPYFIEPRFHSRAFSPSWRALVHTAGADHLRGVQPSAGTS